MKPSRSAIPLLLLTAAVQQANADAVVNDDFATMIQGSGSVTINVLANDTSDSTPTTTVTIQTVDQVTAAYGSVVINNDQTLTYTPPSEDFIGTDTFTYFAVDGTSYGGSATVSIEVTEAPPAEREALAQYVTGQRNISLANYLDEVCFAEERSSGLAQACGSLYEQIEGEGDLDTIVAQIAPDEALTQRQLIADNSRNKTARLSSSLAKMRAGGGGASVSVNNVTHQTGGAAGDDFGSPWTLLSALQYENFERSASMNEAGYDSRALGLMLGLGYRASDSIHLGAAIDWTTYDVDYLANGGNLDSDIYGLTGFVTWHKGPLSFEFQAGYSTGDNSAQRRFTFPVTAYANSSYDSNQINLSTQIDWSWQSGALSIRPFLRLDYLDSEVDGYTETGDSVWLMSASKQSSDQTNTSVGFDTSYTLTYDWGVMVPGFKVSLVDQSNISNRPVAFQLVEADSAFGSFQLLADDPDSQFYQVELSSVFVMKNGVSSFISAQTLQGYDNVSAYRISGGINWEF